MRWLRLRPSSSRDRGATAVILTILFSSGVIIGTLAISVDVGNIMAERRQVQNTADAASFAFAQICANRSADCVPTGAAVQSALTAVLAGNSADGFGKMDTSISPADNGLCGRALSGVPSCDSADPTKQVADIRDLGKCPPLPKLLADNEGLPYVEAYTRTLSPSGATVLPKFFSQAITGAGTGVSVSACSRVAWGRTGTYTASIPLVFSSCEWMKETNNGNDWVLNPPTGDRPGYGGVSQPSWPDTSKEVVIKIHDPSNETDDCSWNGKDTAGGFGWVSSVNCQASVSTDGWIKIDTGNNTPNTCKTILDGLVGGVVNLPVFDCLVASSTTPAGAIPTADGACDPTQQQSNGNNSYYHIAGWAKFYLSGYSLSGNSSASVLPGGHSSCTTSNGNGDRCIYGWFLKGTLDGASIVPPGGVGDFGTYSIVPAG